ncbi:MAG: helix-turn-helix domain-containing protein [Candidatus Accumulibacter sp.]|jgi:AraC-like DNA-binding protein|nr:helix-turn-helix domain-containing protein [Accumulibacter sp.]
MSAKPLREVIATPLDHDFLVFCHDYPFHYTGWHYHPEFEIHLIRRSSGSRYVGTHVGPFGVGDLVMTGSGLPHMWVSDGAREDMSGGRIQIAERDLVIQFNHNFAHACTHEFSDCAEFSTLLDQSRSGIKFSETAERQAWPLLHELLDASGIGRLILFFRIVECLCGDEARQTLSLVLPKTDGIQMRRLNNILGYIADNYSRADLSCREIAERENMQISAFSRFFDRHVRCPCLEYMNRMRIYKSCQMLIETDSSITAIAYDVGYDSLSTFNRNFTRYMGASPTKFRADRNASPERLNAHRNRMSGVGHIVQP